MEWIQALNNAVAFIEQNLTQELSIDDIAAHINISTFHFQRTFSALTGLTLSEYIRNRRLSLAGEELTKKGMKVIDVAYKYGYETPESFAKAFQRFHGITPAKAKKAGASLKAFNPLVIKIKLEGGTIIDYKILKKEAFEVCVLSRLFDEDTSTKGIPRFWDEYFDKRLHEVVPANIGLCTQCKAGSNEFIYGIGCEKPEIKNYPAEFEVLNIPAYTWAIFKCVGAMPDAVQNMWKRIYSEWLPQASYELIPDYDIEYYMQGDFRRDDYVSEIWIPVKEK